MILKFREEKLCVLNKLKLKMKLLIQESKQQNCQIIKKYQTPPMIEFEKTNQKGDIFKAYTHKSYLSKHYNSQICRIEKRNQTITSTIFYGTTIVSYWATNNIPKLSTLVQTKLSWKGRFLIASALAGVVNSFVASVFLQRSLRESHTTLLKKEVFPAWLHKDRVINPTRLFFQLDDSTHNQPNIWHSGITQQAINRLVPDVIIGNPFKPQLPVGQIHH